MYIFYAIVGGREVHTHLCSRNPALSLQSCLVSVNQHAVITHPKPHIREGITALHSDIRFCAVWILSISQLPNLTHACRHFNKPVNCIEYFCAVNIDCYSYLHLNTTMRYFWYYNDRLFLSFCSSHLFILKQKCGQVLEELMTYMEINISSALVHQFYQLTDLYLIMFCMKLRIEQ